MNLQDIEKALDEKFPKLWYAPDYVEYTFQEGEACTREIKSFYRTQILSLLDELKVEDKVYELRPDNPQYSLGQTNGHYLLAKDLNTRIDKIKGELE